MDITIRIEAFTAEVCLRQNETGKSYQSKLLRLARWMQTEQISIGRLRQNDIERFKRSLYQQDTKRIGSKTVSGHLSPFTIHTCLRTVKHFLKWAYAKRLTKHDLSDFKIDQPPPADPKAISAEIALSLLEAASRLGEPWERARNLAMLYVLRDTGGRIGAILESDLNNLQLSKGKLAVIEKGRKPHTLYFNPPTIAALREWLRHRPELAPRDHHLFLSYRGRMLTRSGFYSVMRRLVEAGGLKGKGRTNPHSFRHAWARDALNAGEDLSKVSQTLAHSSVRVTADYYARWADHDLQEAHSKYSPGNKLPIIKPKA